MNKDTYIKLKDKQLVFLFSIFEFDELPVVFICRDESWSLYLCDCTETRFLEQNWVISKTDIKTLNAVANGKLSVYDAFKKGSNRIILIRYDYRTKEFFQQDCEFSQIEEENLPDKDSKLSQVDPRVLEQICNIEMMQAINKKESIIIDQGVTLQFCVSVSITSQKKIDFLNDDKKPVDVSIGTAEYDGEEKRRFAA